MAQTDLKTLIEVTSSGGESFVKDAYYKVFDTKREVGVIMIRIKFGWTLLGALRNKVIRNISKDFIQLHR